LKIVRYFGDEGEGSPIPPSSPPPSHPPITLKEEGEDPKGVENITPPRSGGGHQ